MKWYSKLRECIALGKEVLNNSKLILNEKLDFNLKKRMVTTIVMDQKRGLQRTMECVHETSGDYEMKMLDQKRGHSRKKISSG